VEIWYLIKKRKDNMALTDLSIKEFLVKTASNSPVPGGGSIAALSAAVAASLSEMVARLTIGKDGYDAFEEDMKEIAKDAADYRNKLIKDIDRDSNAYNNVIASFKLPKATEQEQKNRKRAIQEALKNASLVPLDVAKDALKIIELAEKVVRYGNENAVTDGAVAVMMARTAVLSALYNVKINLISINDMDFIEKIKKEIIHMENEIIDKEREILSDISI
jgi:formiminotetrahydrofolate cyclodeaminase